MKQPSRLPESILKLICRLFPDDQARLTSQLDTYCTLLLKANQRINLISRRDSAAIADNLLYDSLALQQFIQPPSGARILDLGSGAGFPGLVIALANPEARIISVEATRRKIEFQRQVVRELGLGNVDLISERAEELTPLEADIAVAKAFSSIGAALTMIAPHLRSGGDLFLPRSLEDDATLIDFAAHGFNLSEITEYHSGTDQRKSQLIHTKKS